MDVEGGEVMEVPRLSRSIAWGIVLSYVFGAMLVFVLMLVFALAAWAMGATLTVVSGVPSGGAGAGVAGSVLGRDSMCGGGRACGV